MAQDDVSERVSYAESRSIWNISVVNWKNWFVTYTYFNHFFIMSIPKCSAD